LELWPYFVTAMLLLFLADIAVRRWEHIIGICLMLPGVNRQEK
jgi:hypothetical protein